MLSITIIECGLLYINFIWYVDICSAGKRRADDQITLYFTILIFFYFHHFLLLPAAAPPTPPLGDEKNEEEVKHTKAKAGDKKVPKHVRAMQEALA